MPMLAFQSGMYYEASSVAGTAHIATIFTEIEFVNARSGAVARAPLRSNAEMGFG